jgi:acyl-CoA reductase-like NAD-dependent aldehyde dehydrogenase
MPRDTDSINNSGKGPVEGSVVFPSESGEIPATSKENLDAALRTLDDNKETWANMSVEDRVVILDKIKLDLVGVIDPWIEKTLDAKGITSNPFGQSEEWVMVAALFRMLRVLRQSLIDIKRYGRPRIRGSIKAAPNGQVVVPAFPQCLKDRIVYQGVSGEVWMEPGVAKEDVARDQAKIYREGAIPGKTLANLGAGSLGMLPIGDFLHKLFVEKKVVILKMNPVNDYIGPLIEEGFAALITPGFLKVAYGGSDVGAYLCNHPLVNAIHITGSDKTFEAILFGTGPDATYRKANRKPLLDKPVTAELGNVSPVIIVPGEWSDADINLQASRLASWLAYNAGCNCLTPRVVIQHKDWALRNRLLEALGDALDRVPTRKAYYPGSDQRHSAVLDAHPDAQLRGEVTPGHIPWTLVADIDSGNREDICFRTESFYSQIGETTISAANVPEFIDRAVEFANDAVWGNLVATLIVHPKSLRHSGLKAALERAIAKLKYGIICVNFFPGIAYTLWISPAGAFPGNDISDIQSGIGFVSNYLMLERAQKSVFRAPFRNPRDPTLFTTRNMDFGRALTKFEITPSWLNLSRLGISVLRS